MFLSFNIMHEKKRVQSYDWGASMLRCAVVRSNDRDESMCNERVTAMALVILRFKLLFNSTYCPTYIWKVVKFLAILAKLERLLRAISMSKSCIRHVCMSSCDFDWFHLSAQADSLKKVLTYVYIWCASVSFSSLQFSLVTHRFWYVYQEKMEKKTKMQHYRSVWFQSTTMCLHHVQWSFFSAPNEDFRC